MQKLSLDVLEKMFQEDVTGKEINFILHIAKYQDDRGVVQGVYYKEVCEAIDISPQKFYDILHSLEEKNIIKVEKNDYIDWDVTICNNDFSLYTDQDYKNGIVKYLSVNHKIFSNPDFLSLKAGAKMIAIDMFRIILTSNRKSNKRSYQISISNFYEKYQKLLHVELRAVQNYLHDVKKLFGVFVKDAKFFFTINSKYTSRETRIEQTCYDEYSFDISCRRNRIKEYTEEEKKDILTVLSQNRKKIRDAISTKTGFSLSLMIRKSIEVMNELQPNKYRWRRELKPALVHKIIDQELAYMV